MAQDNGHYLELSMPTTGETIKVLEQAHPRARLPAPDGHLVRRTPVLYPEGTHPAGVRLSA